MTHSVEFQLRVLRIGQTEKHKALGFWPIGSALGVSSFQAAGDAVVAFPRVPRACGVRGDQVGGCLVAQRPARPPIGRCHPPDFGEWA